jgi:pimeloyl-ACP methyl ester carboxylesterase
LEAAALRAVAIGALCGERVVVAGISVGATLAGWLAARTAIDTAIAIAPFCGIRELYGGLNDLLGATLRAAPNRFLWWDPRRKEAQPPSHGYPRFSTHALGESLLPSTTLDGTAGPHARRVDLVRNAREPVVNDAFARRRFARLEPLGVAINHVVWEGLPAIHDVIEPQIPQARTDLVYPRLIALVESPSE